MVVAYKFAAADVKQALIAYVNEWLEDKITPNDVLDLEWPKSTSDDEDIELTLLTDRERE